MRYRHPCAGMNEEGIDASGSYVRSRHRASTRRRSDRFFFHAFGKSGQKWKMIRGENLQRVRTHLRKRALATRIARCTDRRHRTQTVSRTPHTAAHRARQSAVHGEVLELRQS
eukprot:7385686-Prymnesium_polylepis.1